MSIVGSFGMNEAIREIPNIENAMFAIACNQIASALALLDRFIFFLASRVREAEGVAVGGDRRREDLRSEIWEGEKMKSCHRWSSEAAQRWKRSGSGMEGEGEEEREISEEREIDT